MDRKAYLNGANDAQRRGKSVWDRYALDNDYAKGFDDYMKEHPMCPCGEEAQPDTDPPMCVSCLQESSECPPNAGSGLTPSPAKEQED